ncbi:MAG: CAAX farnesyltransferase (FTase) subunit beta [Heterodermia speciosa]|uniref:Protein farnesyltransferase subunit beta n=1 Tax=Heterodermia speciosa TaxID=116794 RepID=A0A8H3F0J1_9LECA|nr:MAG: CAAX farnesyltransferase (FTase) subunit beta [Heterodermia speciosa]
MDDPDGPNVPAIFKTLPPIRDSLATETSWMQDETVKECLPLLAGAGAGTRSLFDYNEHGVPSLEREKHIEYLHERLGPLPEGFVAFDAARPWLIYWTLTGLCLLGENVDRVAQTFTPMQNSTGGFGGGHGQISHCAPSYAVVLSLAMVGGHDHFDIIDRRALWKWLGELKQSDGGFRVCTGGEEDVRGAYCSMTMISLLGLPLELPPEAPARAHGLTSFLSGLPEYLSRCQTFEGGISGAPQTEAHGAYAFCALSCLSMLGSPQEMIPKYIDLPMLISWLSARQHAPEGGFAGRTNKLIDGCYSHWVGGCWPLIEAAINGPKHAEEPNSGSLFSREGLVRYILACCQQDTGGLRDKPSKYPDAYHTCYVLAGLSSAQHYSYYSNAPPMEGLAVLQWRSSQEIRKRNGQLQRAVFEADDRLVPIHPIYVIPYAAAKAFQDWFASKIRF